MKIDLDKHAAIARAASTQDEWKWDEWCNLIGIHQGQVVLHTVPDGGGDAWVVCAVGDQAHIAANSPPVVLAILDRIERLEGAVKLLLRSASPNERDHPCMSRAWKEATEILEGPDE